MLHNATNMACQLSSVILILGSGTIREKILTLRHPQALNLLEQVWLEPSLLGVA